jgi:hypothetical protein
MRTNTVNIFAIILHTKYPYFDVQATTYSNFWLVYIFGLNTSSSRTMDTCKLFSASGNDYRKLRIDSKLPIRAKKFHVNMGSMYIVHLNPFLRISESD